jgi:hypothetical protein
MGGLPVQTSVHAALRAPMPKLSLPEYHAGMAADAQAQSIKSARLRREPWRR